MLAGRLGFRGRKQVIFFPFFVAYFSTMPAPSAIIASIADEVAQLCDANADIVAKAIRLHQENVSVVRAERLAEDAVPRNDRLHTFLLESIHVAYQHPEYILQLLESGEWERHCKEYVTTPTDHP